MSGGTGISSKNLSEIRDEFTKQAAWFEKDWDQRYKASADDIMAWVMKQLVGIPPDTHALDIACGTGIFTRHLAKVCASVTGLDATPAMLHQANANTDSAKNVR